MKYSAVIRGFIKECFEADNFPWSMDFGSRTMLLKDEVQKELPLEEYAKAAYRKTVEETPILAGKKEKRNVVRKSLT